MSDLNTLFKRINHVVDTRRVHSVAVWSMAAGLSISTVGVFQHRCRNIDPDASMTVATVFALARSAGVEPAWLGFGIGPMSDASTPPASPHVLTAPRIYFIQADSTGWIKIGYSIAPERRMSDLQTGCGSRLRLLATISGDHRKEAALHKRFAHARMSGEWFQPAQDLLAFIASLTAKEAA